MRDDFSERTKLVIAQRAGYRCSVCKAITIGPHTEQEKSLSTGVAAHICAATEGGPRYDSKQSQDERKSICNAIWVCHNCSDRIDKDPSAYPSERLVELRALHEAWIGGRKTAPPPPNITIENVCGVPFPAWGGGLAYESDKNFRWLNLKISAQSSIELLDLSLRVQFPSYIEDWHLIDKPAGCEVSIGPAPSGASIYVEGNGSVEIVGASKATDIILIKAERLRPRNNITIGLKVSPNLVEPFEPPTDVRTYVPFYFDLDYHYVDDGAYLPLNYYYETSVTEHGQYVVNEAKEKTEDVTLPFRVRII